MPGLLCITDTGKTWGRARARGRGRGGQEGRGRVEKKGCNQFYGLVKMNGRKDLRHDEKCLLKIKEKIDTMSFKTVN